MGLKLFLKPTKIKLIIFLIIFLIGLITLFYLRTKGTEVLHEVSPEGILLALVIFILCLPYFIVSFLLFFNLAFFLYFPLTPFFWCILLIIILIYWYYLACFISREIEMRKKKKKL